MGAWRIVPQLRLASDTQNSCRQPRSAPHLLGCSGAPQEAVIKEILTRCGYRCDLCMAFRPNVEQNPANQQILSDGWHRYFGFRLPPETIICDGCWSDGGRLIDRACPVRPCVIGKGIANCASCADYGCERLAERWVVYEDVQQRIGAAIPPEDRARFIAPYENKRRLDALRDSAP